MATLEDLTKKYDVDVSVEALKKEIRKHESKNEDLTEKLRKLN